MPVFTAVAAAVSAAVGGGLFGAVAGFAARTLLTIGITKLIANKAGKTAAGTSDAGSRVQLPPASNNKIPVVYGTAYMAPIITDAKISEDQKTMWYVCTLAEVTDSGSYTFGDIYWGGKKVVFDGSNTAQVVQLETNGDPVQVDDKVNGKIYIYKFPNGSSSGISTGGSNAITLLSDSSIPADQRWNGPIYTTGGQSASMTGLAFLVVKVIYDSNAGTQRLETMSVELTNSLSKPGDVLNDYMTNTRYGCAIPTTDVDSASITTLNNYSDELIDYKPVGWVSGDPYATQPRYRINGPVNTGQNCLNNLQELVDACDSWLQYSELTGKWTIVANKPYDWDGTTIADLYQVTNDNLISGINVNPIDLNNAYNQLEVQYPDNVVKDQTNFNVINLIDFAPEVMSYNEPENKLTVQFPQVNNYVQATYLGLRRMLQSREDLVIDFTLDYSGIQVVAGDVICVPFDPYGWETFESGYGKLFRVSQVQEAKLDDGSLGARITAFEYNQTIYADDPIQDFEQSSNTGLSDPNIIGTPDAPTATLNSSGSIAQIAVSGYVPAEGQVLYMDFNVGNSSNSATHTFYTTVKQSNGAPYTANTQVSINATDLKSGFYYWSLTARNEQVGSRSTSSNGVSWSNGPNVTPTTTVHFCNASSSGTLVTHDALDLQVGANVIVMSGNGILQANSYIANIVSNTQFNLNSTPTVALANACLDAYYGGVPASSLQPGAGGYAVVTSYDVANGGNVILPVSANSTLTRNVPLIYPGYNPGSSYIFPYQQGTASTANGYATNSTGAWTPGAAALLYISNSANTYQGWYKLIEVNISAVPWTTDEFIISQATFNVLTDTGNTTYQLAPYARFSNDLANNVVQTQYLDTFIASNVAPSTSVSSITLNNRASNTVAAVGLYIRNITSGSNLTVYSGTYSVQQKLIGPGSIV